MKYLGKKGIAVTMDVGKMCLTGTSLSWKPLKIELEYALKNIVFVINAGGVSTVVWKVALNVTAFLFESYSIISHLQ